MANIRKQFNFRNGVQVDDDNLVVSPTGLVGIGTTVPTELLHVSDGNARVSGFLTASQLRGQTLTVFDTATIEDVALGNSLVGAGVSVRSGFITATDPAGIVTYYGDGSNLSGVATNLVTTIGIQSGGTPIGTGITSIDFTGTNATITIAAGSETPTGVATVNIAPSVSLGLVIALGG